MNDEPIPGGFYSPRLILIILIVLVGIMLLGFIHVSQTMELTSMNGISEPVIQSIIPLFFNFLIVSILFLSVMLIYGKMRKKEKEEYNDE